MANKDDRRAEILAAARHLFSERGYHAVSLVDIAEEAGLSVGLIYYVFPKKEDILVGVVKEASVLYRRVFDQIRALDDPLERLDRIMRDLYPNLDQGRKIINILYKDIATLDKDSRQQIFSLERETAAKIIEIVEDGQQRGMFKPSVSARHVAFHLIGIGHLWALKKRWLFEGMSVDTFIEEELHLLHSMLLV